MIYKILSNKSNLTYMCIFHRQVYATARTYAGMSTHSMRVYTFIQRGLVTSPSASSKYSRQKPNNSPFDNGMSPARVKYDI